MPIDKLDGDIRFTLISMQGFLEKQGCSEITIEPCTFVSNEDIPLIFNEKEKKILVNIENRDFIAIKQHTNHKLFDFIIDHFLKDYLDDALARFRRKVFGPRGKGISILAPDEKYKLIIESIEEIHLVKIKSGQPPWQGQEASLIYLTSESFPSMNGYYLRLPTLLVESYTQYISQEHKVEVIAFLRRCICLIYYEIDRTLTLEIDLDKPLFISTSDGDGTRSFISTLKQHILVYPKGTYLPIASELEASFIPKGVPRVIWIGAKLEY